MVDLVDFDKLKKFQGKSTDFKKGRKYSGIGFLLILVSLISMSFTKYSTMIILLPISMLIIGIILTFIGLYYAGFGWSKYFSKDK